MPTPRIHVLVVDDHSLLRTELSHIVEGDPQLSVIGEASNGEMAVDLTRRLYPDVVIMDVQMPKMNGIEATRQIKAVCPEVAVIGVSSSNYADAMVEAGASASILKQHAVDELCGAIRRINGVHIREEWTALRGASSSPSLLLIDDDAVFLKSLSDALHDKHPHLRIATALNGEQGVRLLTPRRFDAIISDFRMVGLNGVDFLKECQANAVGIPVVLITGYGTPALEDDAFHHGACAILQKPVDVERLYDVVTRAIRRSRWLRRTHPAEMPLEDLHAHEFAQPREELSVRIHQIDQRLQDTLNRNNPSPEC
ncbi:response regulator [Nitrospira sp. Nam74]